MTARQIVAVAAIALGIAGCAGNPQTGTGPKENTGTAVGALSGAAIGAAVTGGGAGSKVAGGIAGALIGGLIGNRIERRKRQHTS